MSDAAPQSREDSLKRAIAASPREPGNYLALADFYRDSADYRKAEMTLRRVIEIEPSHRRAWHDLGNLCSRIDDWRGAADAFERACALGPADAATRVRLGTALLAIRDIPAAERVRDTLLEQDAGRWEGHLLAGHLHKIHGRVEAAAAAYHRVLDADPRQTDALYNLVDIAPPSLQDSLTQAMQMLRSDASLSNRESANVLFSLARTFENSGKVDDAMATYHEANAAAARSMHEMGVDYEPQRMEAEAGRVIATFARETVSNPLDPLELDMRLVFIIGMPRSGTTLVERILGSHSAVASGGEMPFMQDCLSRLLAARETAGARDHLEPWRDNERTLLLQLREQYLDRIFERDLDADFVVDKLPANFSAIGLIRVLFPDALIIHSVRDPMATCWSLYSAHFGMHLPYNANLAHLGHYYTRIYRELMKHWQKVLDSAIIEIDYDKLVAAPEAEIRSLIGGCGLPWEDRCLAFHESDEPVFTANMLQARQPISASGTSRWRQFEMHLSPLIESLGLGDTLP